MVAALVQMRQAPGEEGLPPMRLHVRGLAKDEPWVDLGVKCESFAWSPDGTEIACSDFPDMDFVLPRDRRSPGATHLVVNVATKKTTALKLSADHVITDWSRDGEHFLTTAVDGRAKDGPRIYLMNRDGTAHKALADGKEPAMFGWLSPDVAGAVHLADRADPKARLGVRCARPRHRERTWSGDEAATARRNAGRQTGNESRFGARYTRARSPIC